MTDVYRDPAPDVRPMVSPADPVPLTLGGDHMPDITKAQIVALVQAVLAALVAFGVDLSKEQQESLVDLAAAVGGALILGDAILRHGRSKIVLQREAYEMSRGPIKPKS